MACFLSNHGTHACIINLFSNTGNEAAEVCLRAQPFPEDFVPLKTAGKYGEIKEIKLTCSRNQWIKATFCGRCKLFWRRNGADFVNSGG